MKNNTWRLYILKLEQGRWYVGITSKTVERRFYQHKTGRGANWTRKYKPLKIHYQKDLGKCDLDKAQLYEGRVTRLYMEKYGDNNVRGGDLTHTEDYIKRFGYFFPKNDWEVVTVITALMLFIILMFIDKYLQSIF